jgi:transcriptional regulator NrdR family protein
MNCGKCGAWSSVDETRKADGGLTILRRRRCANGHRFTTYEVPEPSARPARATIRAAEKRAALAKRNASIVQACQTRPNTRVAAMFGITEARVRQIVRSAS